MTLDQERAIFRQELGHALNEWAEVENSIRYAVLTIASTEEQRRALSVGYFAIEAFRSKLAFANSTLARNFAGTALADEWEELHKRANAASGKRNKLAHRTAKEYEEAKAGRRVLLVPWRYPKPKKKTTSPKPPDDSLGLRAVVECRLEFTALSAAILNWAFRASGKAEPFEKDVEKAGRVPSVAALLKQARTLFK